MSDVAAASPLVCAECGAESEGSARGWRALLTGEEGEVDGVEVFCPACVEPEFEVTSSG